MLNPFSSYSKAEKMPSEKIYKWFSSKVFNVSELTTITNQESQFVIGTPGSGKTMLLRMLTYEVQREIQEDNNQLKKILQQHPYSTPYIGLYYTFDGRNIIEFCKNRFDAGRTENALADYFGLQFLKKLIQCFNDDKIFDFYNIDIDIKNDKNKYNRICEELSKVLFNDGYDICFKNWNELEEWISLREREYQNFFSYNSDDLTIKYLFPITYLCDSLIISAKNINFISEKCSLYIIIDQADRAINIDIFSKVLLKAIYNCTRAPESNRAMTHLKIGLRRDSIQELSRTSLGFPKIDRELNRVNINHFEDMNIYEYKKFLMDICEKRLQGSDLELNLLKEFNLKFQDQPKNILKEILENITPEQEINTVIKNKKDKKLHFKKFKKEWENRGVPINTINCIESFANKIESTLEQVYFFIVVSKFIDKGKFDQEKIDNNLTRLHKSIMNNKENKDLRAKFEEASIYIILKVFGRYRKTYSGISDLISASGWNVTYFVNLIGRIFDSAERVESGNIKIPISWKIQTSSVYQASSDAWRNMLEDYKYGGELGDFLTAIAEDFQLLLENPALPRTHFSALSMSVEPQQLIKNLVLNKVEKSNRKGQKIFSLILRDSLEAGYIHVKENKKNRNIKYEIHIDKIFLPKLGIPFQRKQSLATLDLENTYKFFENDCVKIKGEHLISELQTKNKSSIVKKDIKKTREEINQFELDI